MGRGCGGTGHGRACLAGPPAEHCIYQSLRHPPTFPLPLPSHAPCPQEARALEGKQRQLEAALKRAQLEGRALGGQQERVAALGAQLAEAQVCTALYQTSSG